MNVRSGVQTSRSVSVQTEDKKQHEVCLSPVNPTLTSALESTATFNNITLSDIKWTSNAFTESFEPQPKQDDSTDTSPRNKE